MINQGDRLQEFAKSVEAFVSDLRNLGEPEGSSYSLDLREIDARKVIELAIAQVPHIPFAHQVLVFEPRFERALDQGALNGRQKAIAAAQRHVPDALANGARVIF